MPREVRDCDQIRGEREDAVELGLRLGSPPCVDAVHRHEEADDEPGAENHPWHGRSESLDRFRRRRDANCRPATMKPWRTPCPATAFGDVTQGRLGHEDQHPPASRAPASQVRRGRGGKQPSGLAPCAGERRGGHAPGADRLLERSGDPGHTAEIDALHVEWRGAGDQRRGQIRPASGRWGVAPIGRHNRPADAPLIRRAVGCSDLLRPGSWKAVRGEPPRHVPREVRFVTPSRRASSMN
jgi:hypothetical protein